jgi:hypothetical protein
MRLGIYDNQQLIYHSELLPVRDNRLHRSFLPHYAPVDVLPKRRGLVCRIHLQMFQQIYAS